MVDGGLQRNAVTQVERVEREPVEGVKSNVVQKPVIKPAPSAPDEQHVALGRAVLAKMVNDGDSIISTKDGMWFYTGGVWSLRTDAKWLNWRIEAACRALSFKNSTKLINDTRNWIERDPDIIREDELPWDQHGKIPTRSGLVDPLTGALEPACPDHFCTWRVEVEYDRNAECPWWTRMVTDMFGDREDDERDALVRVIQECMGAALIDKKPRALSKALVYWGIENLGKSGPLDVVGGLFGGTIAAPIASVEGTHGLMPFIKRRPWVLHEAFGGQWHFSSNVKAIITQEPVGINIKNGPVLTQIVRAPIFWATNFQPQFKEATRAIVSRMIVIEVSRQFDEKNPIGAAAEAIKRGFSKPGEFVIATELPGVLNWAIAGLKRALQRGSIEVTAGIKETAAAIHRDSNLVAGFLEDCVEFDPMARVAIVDFCLAHSAWFVELKSEDRRLPTNEAIGKAMSAVGDRRIGMNRKEMRDKKHRYYCGIALNKAGLGYHRTAFESRLFEGKVATATDPANEVNSLIPVSWDDRKSVVAMRKSHPEPQGINVKGEDAVIIGVNEEDGR
ncbi:hypothetical protein [Bradyrhizobium sp. I1.7.5]|uniref:hypothetical protein n=1 Tax=Bradyrhizobium sp. I1.7.5 TaxID=3156363 RepID=UPI0033933421